MGLVRGKYIPAGLHAAEASYVSALGRCGLVRCLWLTLLRFLICWIGLVGVDHALHIVWVRFRKMRRYLAQCPDEEPWIFRMLDLISRGASGHRPVHVLLISAAELVFAWDGVEKSWVRPSLPPLRMMTGPIQHFFSSILDAWRYSVFVKLSEREGFRGVLFAYFLKLFTTTCLFPSEGRRQNVVKSHFMWWGLERIPSWSGHSPKKCLRVLFVFFLFLRFVSDIPDVELNTKNKN